MDTQVVPGMVVFGGAGGRSNEGRLKVDGISVGSAFNGAGVSSYIADVGNAQEVTMTTSGGLGEAEVGGPSLNIVPKEGGNSVRGSFYAAGVTEGMVGSNYTRGAEGPRPDDAGRAAQGLGLQPRRRRADQKDRLWFFGTFRDEGSERTVPGHVRQRQRRRPDEVDLRRRPHAARPSTPRRSASTSLRLTAQVTPRNKFDVFWDEQMPCEGGAAAGFSGSACRTSGRRAHLRRIDRRADAVGIGDARAGDGGVSRLRQARASRRSGRRR